MKTADNSAARTQGNQATAEPVEFQKRVGSTNFVVSVHFSRTSKERLEDKLLRLIESEVRDSALR